MRRHWLAPGEERQEAVYEAMRAVAAPVLRRMLTWIRFEGLEHVPTSGPAILAANHRSLVDPLLIGLGIERHVHFVADSWLGRAMGPLLRPSGVLFLPARRHRTEALLERAGAALQAGQLVGIFPEGMDNFLEETPPRSVGSFHTAFARLWWQERAHAVPILPVAVVGSLDERRMALPGRVFGALDPCNPRFAGRRVWGVVYRSATVRFGPPVPVPATDDEAAAVRELTERTRQAIIRLMEP